MELSTAWLEWWLTGASHELMLFASVGILLIGLDDVLFVAPSMPWIDPLKEATAWLALVQAGFYQPATAPDED